MNLNLNEKEINSFIGQYMSGSLTAFFIDKNIKLMRDTVNYSFRFNKSKKRHFYTELFALYYSLLFDIVYQYFQNNKTAIGTAQASSAWIFQKKVIPGYQESELISFMKHCDARLVEYADINSLSESQSEIGWATHFLRVLHDEPHPDARTMIPLSMLIRHDYETASMAMKNIYENYHEIAHD